MKTMNAPKILLVVTSTGCFADGKTPTGLWLSELTHIYHQAQEQGYEITVANPKGGATPIDPECLKPIYLDEISKSCWETPEFRNILNEAPSLETVKQEQFDCVYLAGGHGAMYDFPDNATLQEIIRNHYLANKIVAAICHGVCGLLNVKLPQGDYLINGKKLTGFSWFEESLAGRKKEVPFDLEAKLKERGADYEKSLIPMTPKVVVDGNLITGQDPFSSQKMAEVVVGHMHERAMAHP